MTGPVYRGINSGAFGKKLRPIDFVRAAAGSLAGVAAAVVVGGGALLGALGPAGGGGSSAAAPPASGSSRSRRRSSAGWRGNWGSTTTWSACSAATGSAARPT